MVTTSEGSGEGTGSARSKPSRPFESHGRALSTTPEAARHYQVAQDRHRDKSGLVGALQRAVDADPGFAVAAADLSALEGRAPVAHSGPLHTWERHHLEVLAAARRDVQRAADLLREHLAVVRCDPVVTAVVVGAATDDLSADILGKLPDCHYGLDAGGQPVEVRGVFTAHGPPTTPGEA
jgi:hypothetical protein